VFLQYLNGQAIPLLPLFQTEILVPLAAGRITQPRNDRLSRFFIHVTQIKWIPVSMAICSHIKNSVLAIISQPRLEGETDNKTAESLCKGWRFSSNGFIGHKYYVHRLTEVCPI
jgi:hypothetical protein